MAKLECAQKLILIYLYLQKIVCEVNGKSRVGVADVNTRRFEVILNEVKHSCFLFALYHHPFLSARTSKSSHVTFYTQAVSGLSCPVAP